MTKTVSPYEGKSGRHPKDCTCSSHAGMGAGKPKNAPAKRKYVRRAKETAPRAGRGSSSTMRAAVDAGKPRMEPERTWIPPKKEGGTRATACPKCQGGLVVEQEGEFVRLLRCDSCGHSETVEKPEAENEEAGVPIDEPVLAKPGPDLADRLEVARRSLAPRIDEEFVFSVEVKLTREDVRVLVEGAVARAMGLVGDKTNE